MKPVERDGSRSAMVLIKNARISAQLQVFRTVTPTSRRMIYAILTITMLVYFAIPFAFCHPGIAMI